ncbi:MAG: hypothetical protein ABI690_08945 [Chloroflexota bacterium]
MQDQSRWLSLPKGNARKITLLMGIPVLLAYIAKILLHQSLEYDRGPYGSLWWIICPIACFIGMGLVVFLLALTIFAVRRAQHAAPAVLLIVGLGLSIFFPLPPLAKPIFPEEALFINHRSDFELVINLAQQDKLECVTNWGCEVGARKLPPDFDYLSNRGHVQVSKYPPGSLTVTFVPFNSYYPIFYFEKPEDRNRFWYSECWDSRYTRKLDEHWYLCADDWL